MLEFISQPWPWYVAGPMIALVLFVMLYVGKIFGVSSNLRTVCAIAGGSKYSSYFDFNWKDQVWNLVFIAGAIIGGFIAAQFLTTSNEVELAQHTVTTLEQLGFENPGASYLPNRLFGIDSLGDWKAILILLIGGLLIGFGARYAGGCTSGHAITGLSNLQVPSLIAVVGFFIGGLLMVHVIFPLIF